MKPIKLKYEARIWPEGQWYIASAWPLDVVTAGKSRDEAEAMLREAVLLFLEEIEDIGTTADVLQECGYREESGVWVHPDVSTSENVLSVA